MSYQEVDQLSDRLADLLFKKGLIKGDVVAILAQRNAMLVVCTLAIMKVGAAYLMVSDSQPDDVLLNQIAASKPSILIHLTDEINDKLTVVMHKHQGSVMYVDHASLVNDRPDTQQMIVSKSRPDDLAYIAFTSGTESKPKIVKGRHSSLTAYLPWIIDQFKLSVNDRFAMLSGLLHDPWQRDVFTPLILGATLYIPDEKEFDFAFCMSWLRKYNISVLNLTPGLASYLLNIDDEPLFNIKTLFLGGERLNPKQLKPLFEIVPHARLINFYGTTETCRALSYYELKPTQNESMNIPIGKGIADVQLIVLNQLMTQCAIGELGEIGIRSPHLSLGYQDDVELTKKKFIGNPKTTVDGDIIYLTGDRGYYLGNGDVYYLDRADRQIKINGHRIEISSIEHQLCDCLEIERAYVRIDQNHQIHAYICLVDGFHNTFDTKQFKHKLKLKLPQYTIPKTINVIDLMPLTANGKVDVKKLDLLIKPDQQRTLILPINSIEMNVLDIWKDLLQTIDICVSDDFFDVGGHSLLVTQLFIKINTIYGVQLSYKPFYTENSIQLLASQIEHSILLDDVLKKPSKQNLMII
ncbi:MAG: non-ribosomal peptide synthetase [Alcanivoracaceae bacterium]|nr:non-ribosomal peptide synthetase [Alcanivoracaceae bacterium]